MADCCLIKKVATVEVYENKNEVRAYGFMAGDRNTPVMEVRFKHLWGESNLSTCKLRWIIVDDVGSLLVGEVPIQSDNTALINLPNELFTGDRRMKVQLTVASCDGERILNLQQFTDLKVINSLAPNEVVEPVYQILINAIYDESQKYLKELETSYTQKYGSLDSLYKNARASLEQYLITAENGGNAEFLQGYSPAHFQKVENTISDLIASTKYKVGDIVEVLGYYVKGDGAGHSRQKKPVGYNGADAIIGADGSIWGIVHNGEVNVSWTGNSFVEVDGVKKYKGRINSNTSIDIKKSIELELEGDNKDINFNHSSENIKNLYISKTKSRSNKTGIGLKLGVDIQNAIVDSYFSNMEFSNYDIGLKTTYSWCNLFQNIRFQNCNSPATLESQTNNTLFSNCSFVTYNQPLKMSNCEGITFESCNISNVSNDYAITMFQSNAIINNPYFENIQKYIVAIGSSNETNPSQLIINGGIGTGDILLNGNDCKIIIKGTRFKYNIDSNFKSPIYSEFDCDSKLIYSWDKYSQSRFIKAFGGANLTQISYRDYSKVTLSASGNGILLYNNLEAGKYYTLALKLYTNRPIVLRNGSLNLGVVADETKIRTYHFKATDIGLRLMFDSDIELEMVEIYEGAKGNFDLKLRNSNIWSGTYDLAAGTWSADDVIINSSGTVIKPTNTILSLDTPYHATQMASLGILDSYHNCLSELYEYEKSQNVQSDSGVMNLNILQPPVIPVEVEAYAKEYNLI